MSNLQNQNALRHDRFQKQNTTQHDSIPFKPIRLPQFCLNSGLKISSQHYGTGALVSGFSANLQMIFASKTSEDEDT